MKIGERVTGVPGNPPLRRQYPTVTGYYDFENVNISGVEFKQEFVVVDDHFIDCKEVRPATRREKDTVLQRV